MKARHSYTPEFKAKVVLKLISGEKGLMQASREYGIKDSVLSRWRQEFLERAPQLSALPKKDDQSEARLAELECMVGRLTMQLELAKIVC